MNPFTISLSSGIQINPSENGYTIGLVSGNDAGATASLLTVPALPGFENAIALSPNPLVYSSVSDRCWLENRRIRP